MGTHPPSLPAPFRLGSSAKVCVHAANSPTSPGATKDQMGGKTRAKIILIDVETL